MASRSLHSSAATRSHFVRTLLALACATGAAGLARGQDFAPYPPLLWAAQESLQAHPLAHDQGVAIEYWYDSGQDEHWVFVTGYVTEMDDDTVLGTRVATFKYDATFWDSEGGDPPDPTDEAYFPELGTPLSEGSFYQARAMALDPASGDIYVAGVAPRPSGSDLDYLVIKYDKGLNEKWAQYYNGPVSGNDAAADIALAIDSDVLFVVVTGTSPGDGTGLDIATIALNPDTGEFDEDSWPDVGWGDGVRRYNNDAADGDDRAAAVAADAFDVPNQAPYLEQEMRR
ncbi:MAG: hypothetical protein ACF8R7_14880 [Phycisphaerales bacterium JB039]